MFRVFSVAAMAIGFLLAALSCSESNSIKLNQGELIPLSGDRILLLNYWAKWCKPCIHEIPELNTFVGRYQNLQLIGVDFDGHRGDELQALVNKMSIQFPVVIDRAQLSSIHPQIAASPSVLPTSHLVFIDQASGNVKIKTLVGEQTADSIIAQIENQGLQLR